MKKNNVVFEIIFISIAFFLTVFALQDFVTQFLSYNKKETERYSLPSGEEKRILFLSSYSLNEESTFLGLRGLWERLDKKNVTMDMEFMDMNAFSDKKNFNNFYESISHKIRNSSAYDAIVAESDFALEFVEKYQKELFDGIPIVFFGVNDYDMAIRIRQNEMFTGEVEDFLIDDIVRIAGILQPKISHVILITDNTIEGKFDQENIKLLNGQFPEYSFSVVNTSMLTRQEFGEILRQIEKDHIIIYLEASEDSSNNHYSSMENVKFISTNTSLPVFTKMFSAIGNGFVGGFAIDYKSAGQNAGEKIIKILEGSAVSEIPYTANSTGIYIFDSHLIRKYDFNKNDIPISATFVNQDRSFLRAYGIIFRPIIFFLLAFILSFIVFIHYNLKINNFQLTMKHDSMHDSLTGLYNRSVLRNIIEQEILKKTKFSIILVDINDFRIVNDLYFHECGDALLKETSERLKKVLEGKNYEMARCFSDNFLVIVKDEVFAPGDEILRRVKDGISEPFKYENLKISVTACVGVDVYNGEKISADEVLSNVEMALEEAKSEGKNKTVFFTSRIKESKHVEKEIENELEDAIFNNGFTVLYQPQIDVKTGEVYGFEALSRLMSGKYNPAQFIPVAEKNGMIPQIGRIVTEKAIRQMSKWRKEGIALKKMSINFSAGQLADYEYVSYLRELLEIYDIPANLVEIEITESLFMGNSKKATQLFEDFKKIGVKLALDDFGTGYSSLSYLTYLPVDMIKIDKSIVDNYLRDETEGFIASLSALIHSLKMEIIVEGVEQEWQFLKLRKWDFDYIQGYLFSRPLKGEEAGVFVPQTIEE